MKSRKINHDLKKNMLHCTLFGELANPSPFWEPLRFSSDVLNFVLKSLADLDHSCLLKWLQLCQEEIFFKIFIPHTTTQLTKVWSLPHREEPGKLREAHLVWRSFIKLKLGYHLDLDLNRDRLWTPDFLRHWWRGTQKKWPQDCLNFTNTFLTSWEIMFLYGKASLNPLWNKRECQVFLIAALSSMPEKNYWGLYFSFHTEGIKIIQVCISNHGNKMSMT